MRQRTKRMSVFLLVLALGLTACGREEAARRVDFQGAPAYMAEDVPLPVQTGDLIGCCTDGTYMYILADEKAEEEVRSVLTRVRLADGTAEIMEDYQSSNTPEDAIVNRLGPALAPDGTLWLYEIWMVSTYDLPEDFDNTKESKVKYRTSQEEFHHLRQLDPVTGRERDLVDLGEAVRTLSAEEAFAGDWLEMSGFTVDGGGNICFSRSGGVAALTVLPGGKREVRTIDVSARDWGNGRYALPGGTDLLFSGTGGFLFFYINSGALWGWEPGAAEGRRLLSWTAAELPGVVMCAAPLDGSRAAALTQYRSGTVGDDDYLYQTELRLSMLFPANEKPSNGRTRLVFGTIGTSSLQRRRINTFNKTNDQYYIELRNYAGDGVEVWDLDQDKRDAAEKLLNAEVVSGRAPDIWDSTLPAELYARKGLLEDLWPWIDRDPEISREDLMTHVLDCASVDRKLYRVFNSFSIQTAIVCTELMGNRTGWTLEEMMDCYRSMPEDSSILLYFYGKSGTLRNLIRNDMDRWVDWNSGECLFDSEEFKTLLELCGREDNSRMDAEWGEERMSDAFSGVDLRAGR